MLIGDRVLCDQCMCVMGQLHHMPVEQSDFFSDSRTAPDYAVCPDCQASMQVLEPLLEQGDA